MTPSDYEYLRKLLKDHSGLDLSADKQYLIESRLLPLSRKCGVPGIGDLVQKMKGGSSSIIAQVVEAMTTNETFFFRDKVPFEHFRGQVSRDDFDAPSGQRRAHFLQRHRKRIRLLAGRAGSAPYPDALSVGARLQHFRHDCIAKVFERHLVAEEEGFVGGHGFDHLGGDR